MKTADIYSRQVQTTNEKGFTLIEALVALVVLTIGILTLFTMQAGSVRSNFRASQITIASAWAAELMEEFNTLAYDDDRLQDANNDSLGQDGDANGIDDDDEGNRVDDIGNFGLDQNEAETADFILKEYPGMTMYYNVAIDQPVEKMKTIRVLIVRESDQQQLVFEYYKAAPL